MLAIPRILALKSNGKQGRVTYFMLEVNHSVSEINHADILKIAL